MKICPNCRSQINKKASICPYCRFKQKQNYLPWIILGIVIVLIVAAVGTNDDDKPKSVDSNGTTEKSEAKKDFEQNEIVEYRKVKYQVTGVKKSQGSTYDKPAKGKEFVIVKVKIVNGSNEKISYNPYDWKMTDSTGNEENFAFTTVDNETSMNSGNLDAGGTVEKTISFEKPINDKGLKLRYYDSIIDDDYAFQISIK